MLACLARVLFDEIPKAIYDVCAMVVNLCMPWIEVDVDEASCYLWFGSSDEVTGRRGGGSPTYVWRWIDTTLPLCSSDGHWPSS
jgi:hypothetical protein